MKAKVYFFTHYLRVEEIVANTEKEHIEACQEMLEAGRELKFVLSAVADFAESIVMLFIGVSISMEHEDIYMNMHSMRKQKGLFIVSPPNLGGGRMKIENGELHFFSSSYSMGPYSECMLKKAEVDIKEKFGIDSVHYSTDYIASELGRRFSL
ncbi:MAG: hypothetical protein WC819_04460 [Parcubacteria group bacterium]|jgi:hypothetical protein